MFVTVGRKALTERRTRSSNARAKPFSSYSATKGLFRLVRYRFVLARPLIPPHASPRKQQFPNKEPRLRSLRICLRVDEFKLYSQGQGSLLGRYEDFRKWFPVAPAPPGGEGTSEEPVAGAAAKARVEWVKRIECGEESSSSSKKKQQQKDETDSGAAATKVDFLQDVRTLPLFFLPAGPVKNRKREQQLNPPASPSLPPFFFTHASAASRSFGPETSLPETVPSSSRRCCRQYSRSPSCGASLLPDCLHLAHEPSSSFFFSGASVFAPASTSTHPEREGRCAALYTDGDLAR